jgi:hypothetical protein
VDGVSKDPIFCTLSTANAAVQKDRIFLYLILRISGSRRIWIACILHGAVFFHRGILIRFCCRSTRIVTGTNEDHHHRKKEDVSHTNDLVEKFGN